MKKPRVEDFDPHYTPPLASPLEGMPAIIKPATRPLPTPASPHHSEQATKRLSDIETSRQSDMSLKRQSDLATKRLIKKDFYISTDDDIKLDSLIIERRRNGQKVDRSMLIREAIALLEK